MRNIGSQNRRPSLSSHTRALCLLAASSITFSTASAETCLERAERVLRAMSSGTADDGEEHTLQTQTFRYGCRVQNGGVTVFADHLRPYSFAANLGSFGINTGRPQPPLSEDEKDFLYSLIENMFLKKGLIPSFPPRAAPKVLDFNTSEDAETQPIRLVWKQVETDGAKNGGYVDEVFVWIDRKTKEIFYASANVLVERDPPKRMVAESDALGSCLAKIAIDPAPDHWMVWNLNRATGRARKDHVFHDGHHLCEVNGDTGVVTFASAPRSGGRSNSPHSRKGTAKTGSQAGATPPTPNQTPSPVVWLAASGIAAVIAAIVVKALRR